MFLFRLAGHLGKTLAEVETISREELFEWMAFSSMEPFGCHVEDQRFEYLCSLIYQAHSKPNTKIPRFFDRDTKPKKPRAKPLAAKDLAAQIERVFAGYTVIEAKPDPAPEPDQAASPDK